MAEIKGCKNALKKYDHRYFLIFIVLIIFLFIGCAGMITKWECDSPPCLSRERAVNKCLAQANSAFARSSVKSSIWEQCMRGEGFQSVPCNEYERGREECKLIHVW